MLFSSRMRYIQLAVMEQDFQKALDFLGDFGWVEINRSEANKSTNEKKISFEDKKELKQSEIFNLLQRIEKNIETINIFFNLKSDNSYGELKDINEIDKFFEDVLNIIKPYKEKYDEFLLRKKELQDSINELKQFKNLTISKKDLEGFVNLHFFVGSILSKDMELLKEKLKERFIPVELEKDLYIIFTSKKGRWTVESELKKTSFKEKKIPGEEDKIPKEMVSYLISELDNLNKKIEEIEDFKKDYLNKYERFIISYKRSFNLQKLYLELYSNLKHSETITIIEGWILEKKLKQFIKGIKDLLGPKHSLITYKPEEMEEVRKGLLKVPVFMENNPLIKPFEKLIFNYGTPVYGTIDPTIFVTFSFLVFFGMMYGDIGQGFVIFLVGLILQLVNKKNKDAGFIISAVGISAMIFGYLYGSIFCFEHYDLEFIFRPINKKLFGIDRPYIIDLSAENSLNIFFVTIAFGIIINLTGIFINIVNNILKRKIVNILFSHTGIAGFFMLLSLAIMLLEVILFKKSPSTIFIIITLISIFLIFLKEPLANLITGHKPIFHEGIGMWFFLAFVELFEVLLSTISNNLSFIRIGAFAFAHAILSFTTVQLAVILGGGEIFSIGGIIVLIIGNLLIIALEGMIVGIQTIRLEYYEFFSKFFSEQGKPFIPFKINKLKMEEYK